MLTKLRVGEAHSLARGGNVLVAVIDSQIDVNHPELQGVIAGSYDALDVPDQSHTCTAPASQARSPRTRA